MDDKLRLARRRELRSRKTDSEAALWNQLRGRQIGGFKFRREHSCGSYILDFYCPDARLAIELDGGQHYEPKAQTYDARRDRFLARRRIRVLRFPCDLVFRELEGVLMAIAFALGIEG